MKKISLTFATLVFLFLSHGFSQATIKGHVFNDVNNDLIYEAGEGLNNVTVWLFNLTAVAPYYRVAPVDSAITDANGNYTLSGIPAGDYQIRVRQTTIPPTITRAVSDNDSYPNGLTNLLGVTNAGIYTNIDFGFAQTAIAPSYSSARNFHWNSTNTFLSQTSKSYNLPSEVCGGVTYNPTITWSTDKTVIGSDGETYPEASDPAAPDGIDWPGNSKGGIHTLDTTFELIFGGANYTSVNNDRQTTTILFTNNVVDTKFSIYDIDHADPQSSSGRIDHVSIIGYNGAIPVMPIILNPSAAPWNTVSGNTVYGFADYPLSSYSPSYNSGNEDHGTVNVYFPTSINKIVIEYEEWAPVMLPGKGINDASIPNSLPSEPSWSSRSQPTERGISIGSIDYSFDCNIILPIVLSSFSAVKENNYVVLNWTTSSEYNIKHFVLEKSYDGIHFNPIATIASAGNSSSTKQYNYLDKGAQAEINYYRLRSVDINGSEKLSEVVLIKFTGTKPRLIVLDNPFKNNLSIQFTVPPDKNGVLKLTDRGGKLIATQEFAKAEQQVQFNFPAGKLTSGVYLLQTVLNGSPIAIRVLKE